MLPKGPLGRHLIRKLKVYAGPTHPALGPDASAAAGRPPHPPGLVIESPGTPRDATEGVTPTRAQAVDPIHRAPQGGHRPSPPAPRSSGVITVNRRPIDEYFPSATHRMIITEPLRVVEKDEDYDVDTTMGGGGVSGQAGALRLGIARALAELEPELRASLKRAGFLTRDAREKESKKYGLKKARKAPQYSKR